MYPGFSFCSLVPFQAHVFSLKMCLPFFFFFLSFLYILPYYATMYYANFYATINTVKIDLQ